jgi:serine protease Do
LVETKSSLFTKILAILQNLPVEIYGTQFLLFKVDTFMIKPRQFLNLLFGMSCSVWFATAVKADYYDAKRAYEAMNRDDQTATTVGLIASGDFNGFHHNGFNERYYRAVLGFEHREHLTEDGILAPHEMMRLKSVIGHFFDHFELKEYYHPVTGSKLFVPRSLFDREKPYEKGLAFETTDKRMSLSFSAHAQYDTSFEGLFELLATPSIDRSISYKRIKDQFFVVNGEYKGRKFYSYMERVPYGSTGFTLTWKSQLDPTAVKLSILMANAFSAFPAAPAATAEVQQAEPPPPAPQAPVATVQKPPNNSSGTGFRVTDAGHVLTNFHVAGQCRRIRLHRQGEAPIDATLVAHDEVNDLAIVKAASALPGTIASFSGKSSVRAGSEIVVFGFPLTGLLSDSGNFTTGNITSMAGLGNDSRMFQISAPVQPGNSGGPVLDRTGGVVAVIVSKLNAVGVANQTGDVPQNVNFAIKSNVALGFIDGIGINTKDQPSESPTLDAPSLAEKARDFTFLIECNND